MNAIQLPPDLEQQIFEAVHFFWSTRFGQIKKQTVIGTRDQGNRGAVTGGKQLDGFVALIRNLLIQNGCRSTVFLWTQIWNFPGISAPTRNGTY